MNSSDERRTQLNAGLAATLGPSSTYKVARAWTRLEQYMFMQEAIAITRDHLPRAASTRRFLEHHAKIGDMVPHHLYEGLVFCRQWVGIPIPTEDCLLASFKSMPKLNEDEQKAAPEIQSWKHRLDIATQPPLTRLRLSVQDSLDLAVSSLQMAHSARARSQQEKSTARMQVWHILRGKNKTPFFVSTPTHTVPQEPRFESLQEDRDILFGAEPPVFPPRLLALKDGIAEVDKGKCTHTLLHTFTRANLHLHPLSLSDRAAEVVSGQDRRDSSGNWRRTPGSGRREPSHERYSSGRPKSSNETKTIILTAPNYLHMHTQKVILREAATSTSWVQIVSSRQCQWTQRSHPTAPGATQASHRQSQMTPANSDRCSALPQALPWLCHTWAWCTSLSGKEF